MNKNKLLNASALGLICGLTACQNYVERHDGVTNFAGDAQAINDAKMAADPWKRNAHNDHLHGDGERLGDAVKRYKGVHGDDSGNNVQPIVLPVIPGTETN